MVNVVTRIVTQDVATANVLQSVVVHPAVARKLLNRQASVFVHVAGFSAGEGNEGSNRRHYSFYVLRGDALCFGIGHRLRYLP